jgi:hypothetical protein
MGKDRNDPKWKQEQERSKARRGKQAVQNHFVQSKPLWVPQKGNSQ